MGLFSKAVAVGIGYALAQPVVRQKLVELVQHPKVKQLRDQSQDLATNGLQTAKQRLGRSSATDTTGADESVLTPPYAGAPTPSPSPHASDLDAFRQGVLPPAAGSGASTAPEEA
jgi:hypothetical protein